MTMTPDTETPTNDDVDDNLTDGERAVLDEARTEDAAAAADTAAPAADDAAADEPAPSAAELAEERMAAAADRLAAAAEAANAAPAEPVAPAVEAEPPRDFDAELAALEQQFDDGDIDNLDFRRQERALIREQTTVETLAAVQSQQEAAAQRAAQERAQAEAASWEQTSAAFFEDPGNKALIADPIKHAGFQAAVNVAYQESGGTLQGLDLLAKAREKITGVTAVDPNAVRNATFERQKAAGQAPTTLRDTPSATNTGDTPGAALDGMDIGNLEDTLAAMSSKDRQRYLESAPGGLNDNQRATG